jgi:hypothetical protein
MGILIVVALLPVLTKIINIPYIQEIKGIHDKWTRGPPEATYISIL